MTTDSPCADCASLHSVHISLFLFLEGHLLLHDLVQVRVVSQDFVELTGVETALLSLSIVFWPVATLTGMQKGRAGQGTASDTFRNSHTNTGIPVWFFFTLLPLTRKEF